MINITQKPEGETVLSTTYSLCRNDINGKQITRIPFEGDEYIMTTCPECGEEFWIDILEFFGIASTGFDFYGTSIFCDRCSARRSRQKQHTDL